ncbi:hypothetical protein Tco_0080573 [Tanacetum coccineum]
MRKIRPRHDLELGAVVFALKSETLPLRDKKFHLHITKSPNQNCIEARKEACKADLNISNRSCEVHPGAIRCTMICEARRVELVARDNEGRDIAEYLIDVLTMSKGEGEHQKPSGLAPQPEIPNGNGKR